MLTPGFGGINVPLRGPQTPEETSKEFRTVIAKTTSDDIGSVVEFRVICHVKDGSRCPSLGVSGTKNNPGDPSKDDGPSAHRTRLERDVEGASFKPPVTNLRGRGSNGQNLGMGRRILKKLSLIPPPPHDPSIANNNTPHRDVAGLRSASRFHHCEPHEALVINGH